jgi:uncharacterized protein (TIGR02996 family)
VAVYFAYRCGYLGPTCKHLRRFDDATVVDWFRRHWRHVNEAESRAYVESILGVHVAYLGGVFSPMEGDFPPPPATMQDVADAVSGTYNSVICFEDHCLQVLTDDDEIDMAYYFFDDVFLERHAGLASLLLRDDWQLPDGAGEKGRFPEVHTTSPLEGVECGQRDGPGWLYAALLDLHSGENLGDLGPPQHVGGVRVADVCRWVMSLDAEQAEEFGYYFQSLRELLFSEDLAESDEERAFLDALRADPGDDLTWDVYSDWLQERGQRAAGYRLLERVLPRVDGSYQDSDAGRNLIQIGDHVVQLFAHVRDNDFDHWFFFDDLWCAAQPDLADALLHYASRWDVLSTGDEERIE